MASLQAQFEPVARDAARQAGIDPDIFVRQITQESGWADDVIDGRRASSAGAQGIAQFMPGTAAQYGVNPLNPQEALYGAAAHMRDLLDMFGGDYAKALAGYNAGPGRVQEYGGIPPFAETRTYVQNILGAGGGQGGALPMGWETGPDGKLIYKPDEGGGAGGPVTRNFPDGTLRALRPGASGTNAADWSVIGPNNSTSPQMPEIIHDASGLAYRFQTTLNGQPIFARVALLDDPTKSATFAPPITPYQQATLGQDAQRIGLQSIQTMGSLEVQRAQLAETYRSNIAGEARDLKMLELQQDNARVEERQGNKQLALQAQGIVEQTLSRIQTNRLERERMTQQMAVVDKQIAASAAESQADREFQGSEGAADRYLRASEGVAGRNLSREQLAVQDAQERARLGLQRDTAISEYAREPGDVGVISAMLQRGGFSNLSTALGQGETAITDRSLEPLASLLAPGPAAYNPRYETAPAAPRPGPITQALNAAQPAAQPAQVAPAAQASPYTPDQQADWMTLLTEGGVPAWARTAIGAPNAPVPGMEDGGAVVEPGVLNGLMKMAMMLGMEPKAVAGERGEANGETVMSNGDVVILPDKGKMAMGKGAEFSMSGGAHYGSAMRDKMPMMMGGGMSMQGEHMMPDMPMMAEGGGVLNPLIAQARAFMGNVGRTTLDRSGFPAPPTPISLADPGTSPYVRRLGAATTATTRGVPQEAFQWELNRLIPLAMQQGLGGRTR